MSVRSDAEWQILAAASRLDGLREDPRFTTLAARKANEPDLDALLSAWTKERNAATLAAELQARGIAAVKSANSVDLIADEHLWARQFYRHVIDQDGEARAVLGPSWRMTDETDIDCPPPRFGEHNDYVFQQVMGLSAEEQARLTEAGAIR